MGIYECIGVGVRSECIYQVMLTLGKTTRYHICDAHSFVP